MTHIATTVRRATRDDTPALLVMGANFITSTRYGRIFEVNAEKLTELVGLLLENGFILVVPDEHDVPIAMIGVAVIDSALDGRRYGDEIMFWVNEGLRQHGAGTALFVSAEAACRQLGCVAFKAAAPLDAPHVAKMLLGHGYEPVETVFCLPLV